MKNWTRAVELYKTELVKEKSKQEKELKRLRKRLNKLNISKGIILALLHDEIRKTKAQIEETTQILEAHETLINETEDGTLDNPYDSNSD